MGGTGSFYYSCSRSILPVGRIVDCGGLPSTAATSEPMPNTPQQCCPSTRSGLAGTQQLCCLQACLVNIPPASNIPLLEIWCTKPNCVQPRSALGAQNSQAVNIVLTRYIHAFWDPTASLMSPQKDICRSSAQCGLQVPAAATTEGNPKESQNRNMSLPVPASKCAAALRQAGPSHRQGKGCG